MLLNFAKEVPIRRVRAGNRGKWGERYEGHRIMRMDLKRFIAGRNNAGVVEIAQVLSHGARPQNYKERAAEGHTPLIPLIFK